MFSTSMIVHIKMNGNAISVRRICGENIIASGILPAGLEEDRKDKRAWSVRKLDIIKLMLQPDSKF